MEDRPYGLDPPFVCRLVFCFLTNRYGIIVKNLGEAPFQLCKIDIEDNAAEEFVGDVFYATAQ